MTEVADMILDPVEEALDKVGLMQGPSAPLKRTIVGGAIGYGVMELWKPLWAYDASGAPLPWRFTNPNKDKNLTTMVPYWMAALVPAFVLGVLI